MWTFLVIALIVVSIVLRIYEPTIKGIIGEKRVKKQLDKLSPENYRVLNDIMVRTEKGTSQIDHVIVSTYGIFVIETKNYAGWIHGSENAEYWTQSIYRKKTKFRNPIRQNWGHIYALKEMLPDYKDCPFYSIIVFAGSAKLKNVNVKTDVIYEDSLFGTIMGHRGTTVIPVLELDRIVDRLRKVSIDDKQARKQHVEQIRSNVKERETKEESLICLKCGGKMLKRRGQYGEFYGCSNYPKCRNKLNAT